MNRTSIFKRTAARAIVNDGDKYLLITSKYGDYKFAGGGMEPGEDLVDTLVREIQEETGYLIIRDSIKKYGKVLEKRKGKKEDIMEMDSHYFFCKVESEAGDRNLDEYEEEYDYQVVWITLPEALEKNKQITNLYACPWIVREIKVMEMIIDLNKYFPEAL